MKKIILNFLCIVISISTYGQTTNTEKKEIKLQGGGYALFFVLKQNPQIDFNPNKEYYWFNSLSGIQSTKGGAGGQLLHGKRQQFSPNGKLSLEMNFNYGLTNGVVKEWDKEGNLISDSKYQNDDLIYTKFRNEEGYFIEWVGELFKKGSVKNVYGKDGKQLLQMDQLIEDNKVIRTVYYTYPAGTIQEKFICSMLGDLRYGYYKSFYKNSQLEIDGNYENMNRIGIWKFYDEFGTLTSTESYRINKEYYPNGKIKEEAGEYFDSNANTWIKHGYSKIYRPDGDYDIKIFNWGTETNKIENY